MNLVPVIGDTTSITIVQLAIHVDPARATYIRPHTLKRVRRALQTRITAAMDARTTVILVQATATVTVAPLPARAIVDILHQEAETL